VTIRCSVFIAVSLDGFIARAHGEIDWLTETGTVTIGEDYGYKTFIDAVDTVVLGRNTYEKALAFSEWPYSGKRVVVLSTGSPNIPDSLSARVEIMSCSATECALRLSKDGAKHVYVDGGRTIQGFLHAGLIDELIITRLPILIGEGVPLFGRLDRDMRLKHVETKSYESGFVQSNYRALRAG